MSINTKTNIDKLAAASEADEPILVGLNTCRLIVFQDEEGRPSLRTFHEWKQKGYFPQVKIGKRIFLNPEDVRRCLMNRFTVEAIND